MALGAPLASLGFGKGQQAKLIRTISLPRCPGSQHPWRMEDVVAHLAGGKHKLCLPSDYLEPAEAAA